MHSHGLGDQRSACFQARRSLELAVHWLYAHDRAFKAPYDDNLAAHIIDHLTANGTIDPAILYDQPYTDIHYKGLIGLFSGLQAAALLGVVRDVNLVVESLSA